MHSLDGIPLAPGQRFCAGEREGLIPERFMRQRGQEGLLPGWGQEGEGQAECLLLDTLRQKAHLKPVSGPASMAKWLSFNL